MMGLEGRLAWRNVWRNPRRTALTVAATVFAVLLVVVFVAMAAGMHEKMIEDSVRIHSGHLQVSGPGYLDNRTLEHFLELDPATLAAIEDTAGVVGAAPRMTSFGLLSKEQATKGIAVIGVDPIREPRVSTLVERVEQGAFLPADVPSGIVLGRRLARSLGAELGDELLLFSVAYTLDNAYDLFTVTGIMKLPEPELDRTLAMISLADAQEFFAYGNRVTEVAVLARDADAVPAVASALRDTLGRRGVAAEVHPWNEVIPELEQFIFIDDAGMYIMLAILVVVVAFGILNTILMAVLERKRELGVLLALGLRPASIFRVIYLESLVLAGVGLVVGLALAIPIVLVLQANPIPLTGSLASAGEWVGMDPVLTVKLKPLNPIGSTITILVVAALAALYPAIKASRARPVDALRSI